MLKRLVLVKMYVLRSIGYLSLVNSGMLLLLTLSNLEKYGIDVRIEQWLLPLVLAGICALVFFGWLEDKLGLWSEENRLITARNPQIAELDRKLDRVLAALEEERKKKS